jgi:hypothetical protein
LELDARHAATEPSFQDLSRTRPAVRIIPGDENFLRHLAQCRVCLCSEQQSEYAAMGE